MSKSEDYRYKSDDGLTDTTTLSPSKTFYYKLKSPVELNKAAFGCPIAFFKTFDQKLLYHRRGTYAHEIHSNEEILHAREKMGLKKFGANDLKEERLRIVHWSSAGNVAYFIEYKHKGNEQFLDSIVINLMEQYCYRINELKNNFALVNELGATINYFDESGVLNGLENKKVNRFSLYRDGIMFSKAVEVFFPRRKWFP